MARAQTGDEAAFARLWRDVNPLLLRYLTLSGEPAEDVAAETWTSIVRVLPRFAGNEVAWRAWVFATARRRAIDAGRRRARLAAVESRANEWRPDPCPGDAADEAIERIGTAEAVRLVAELPALQAEVVLLRFMAGLPVEDVARLLGRSPGAVRVATHRGLRRLAALLADQGVTHFGASAL